METRIILTRAERAALEAWVRAQRTEQRLALRARIALPAFQTYLASLRGYRRNAHSLDADTIARVRQAWGFAVEQWGYEPPTCQCPATDA